jgi:hypothetical protein
MKKNLKYLFYATLLDSYQDYLDSDIIYQEYWGFSEEPPFTEDEFHEKKRLELIDRINRVPFDSEKADKGTAFNEIVDCMITGCNSEKMKIEKVFDVEEPKRVIALKATYNNREFTFPISICREFSEYYKGAVTQVYTEAVLPTCFGDVQLYGYIDELMPASVHDIKTTGKYSAGKFKHHWQKVVYPYCLSANGNKVYDFEYNVLLINERKYDDTYETFTEFYNYVPDTDIPRLIKHVESLIEFVETHKDLITDKKIFNNK